jgi:N-acetyl-1-D-myo-inositol-2-amino-2-deoxy-alpha-D-glucopyranoside deacetylase
MIKVKKPEIIMSKQKTLVFCGAHPDDETFGFGATLAQYASQGVKVYYICLTRGEAGTVDPEYLKGYSNIGDLRWAELKCAVAVLGLSGLYYLGYRDSGMKGSEDNRRPDSLAMAPVDEVAKRLVKLIRELKPDVVVTHDEGGGYGHPDHLATHAAVVRAFRAASNGDQYPEEGPPFQPSKLYFGFIHHGLLKLMIKLMPLFGQNPHHFGRNKDIDLTTIISVEYPAHAVIKLKRQSMSIRNKAAACHASQGGARPYPFGILKILDRVRGQRDYFMRAYPPPSRRREKDLFEGL